MSSELFNSKKDKAWLDKALKSLRENGFAVVESIADKELLAWTREAMYRVKDALQKEVGRERLERAGEMGVLRLMMRFEPGFTRFLELPEVLAVIDATVSSTAVMHLQ